MFFTILFGSAWLGNTKAMKDAKNSAKERNPPVGPIVTAPPESPVHEPRGEPARPEDPLSPLQISPWQAKVNEVCFRYSGKDFYPGELIPKEKLKTAVGSYPLPDSGPAMALIDCTLLGSADDGVLIGLPGVSWRNMSEPKSLRWRQMSSSSIEAKGISSVALGANEKLDLAGSAFPRGDVVKLLRELTEAYKHHEREAQAAPMNESTLIDIRTASYKELLTLPGIGPAEAALVLKRRVEAVGPYSLEELATLLQLKPHIVERLRGKVTFSKRQPGVSARPEPKAAPSHPLEIDLPRPRNDGRIID